DKLRAVLWLQVQAKDLPSEEALRKKVNADPKNGQALCDLGCVLAANGKTTEALDTLLQAGQLDRKLVASRVKETMVKIFFVIGVRSEMADAYRDKLTKLLYLPTRPLNSPSSVRILILSPFLICPGTRTWAPDSIVASFVTEVAVSPRAPSGASVTSASMICGNSTCTTLSSILSKLTFMFGIMNP